VVNIHTPFVHHLCYLPIAQWVSAVLTHIAEDNVSFIMTPLERFELGHRSRKWQRLPTLAPAASVFATQPGFGVGYRYT
jgi:hypothetical protein